jgi:hypothetical protein
MDDKMWTTETEDSIFEAIQGRARVRPEETETISDDDARTLLQEQLGRRIAEISRVAGEMTQREREQTTHWQEAERELRNRALRANWPEPDRRATERERERERGGREIGFLHDFLEGKDITKKKLKKDKILKPLPDELFEID